MSLSSNSSSLTELETAVLWQNFCIYSRESYIYHYWARAALIDSMGSHCQTQRQFRAISAPDGSVWSNMTVPTTSFQNRGASDYISYPTTQVTEIHASSGLSFFDPNLQQSLLNYTIQSGETICTVQERCSEQSVIIQDVGNGGAQHGAYAVPFHAVRDFPLV